jgi:tRNA dimethylallyltransferase
VNQKKQIVPCLTGPTAAGKTELALSLASNFPIDIVNADSAQIYRGMNIGTAKPSESILNRYPHYLIDIIDPEESYSVGNFVRDASFQIDASIKNNRIPLIVGGTMLYLNSLCNGIAQLPEKNMQIRKEIEKKAQKHGWGKMYAELKKIDLCAASNINKNDKQRIQRALEVYYITGKKISELQEKTTLQNDYQFEIFSLKKINRDELYSKINNRFLDMLDAGFVDEVRILREREGLSSEHMSMRSVGYRQIWKYLDNEIDLNEATGLAQTATRQLAKRQLTWMRSMKNLTQESHKNIYKKIESLI